MLSFNEMKSKLHEKLVAYNSVIKTCQRCGLAYTRRHALCGQGNIEGRIMLIAQAPGKIEDQKGEMFIGTSGKYLDELLKRAAITRDDIYMTNLIKCKLPGNREPRDSEIDACTVHLMQEIVLIDPEIIIPLGYWASRYILGNFNAQSVTKNSLSDIWGKFYLVESKVVYPLPHPSALIYKTSRMPEFAEKYRKLNVLLKPCKWYPVCPIKHFTDQGKLDPQWVQLYCRGDWESCVRYHMEENSEYHPDWMLPDGTLDEQLR